MTDHFQLMHLERATPSTPSQRSSWSRDEVLDELERVLQSRFFVKSDRLSSFLRTAIAYLLEGRANELKEYTVGTEVYKRPSSYDPTQDSIVRTEARRLRSKLKEYYAATPASGPIMILLIAGSYIPVIKHRGPTSYPLTQFHSATPALPSTGERPSFAVVPFSVGSADSLPQHMACKLENELTHELSQMVTVFRATASSQLDPCEQLRLWSGAGVNLLIQGHVTQQPDGILVQIQLTTISGMIVWSKRFHCDSSRQQNSNFGGILPTILTSLISTSPN
jgi:TolB-like protein